MYVSKFVCMYVCMYERTIIKAKTEMLSNSRFGEFKGTSQCLLCCRLLCQGISASLRSIESGVYILPPGISTSSLETVTLDNTANAVRPQSTG